MRVLFSVSGNYTQDNLSLCVDRKISKVYSEIGNVLLKHTIYVLYQYTMYIQCTMYDQLDR